MRDDGWLQKLLYLLMIILGGYILYKGGGILLSGSAANRILQTGSVQRHLEDAAMRTYAPGYTAAVEGRSMDNWIPFLMGQAVPVYSYVASEYTEGQTEAGSKMAWIQAEAGSESAGEPETEDRANVAGAPETEERVEAAGESETEERVEAAGEAETEERVEITDGSAAEGEPAEQETDGTQRQEEQKYGTEQVTEQMQSKEIEASVQKVLDFEYLLNHYYTVDSGTTANEELLDASVLLSKDLRLEQDPDVPQILIYHTHSQEAFADSRKGIVEDTIVGTGEVLAEHLRAYGYQVIHDTGVYDLVDGVLDRSAAYDHARASIQQILEEYPTIEVLVDLHRDGVDGMKFVTEIGGKPCSKIMFFNGISRNSLNEPLAYLANPYIEENLAFSLQLQIKAKEQYPDYTRNIYLKAERFNLHLRPRSLLIEAGTQLNTIEEENNAMEPLAALIYQVLSGT